MQLPVFMAFAAAALAHFLALLSPGPDFVLVVKSALRHHRHKAVGVAVGIASANALYIALCLVGVGELLTRSVAAMLLIKIAGGAFLTYLAWSALRARKRDYRMLANIDIASVQQTTFLREFVTGFLSGILNPKNPLFYLSLFTLVLDHDVTMAFKVALGIWMTSIVLIWDAFIILVLSRDRVRSVFARFVFYIDKFTGMILGGFGLTLLYSSVTENF